MATNEHRRRLDFGRLSTTIRRVSRYDFVLAIIPTAFLAAILAEQIAQLSAQTAVTVASLIGLVAVVDALFLNPPRKPTGGRSAG